MRTKKMIEAVLTTILVMSLGVFIGSAGKTEQVKQQIDGVTPDRWPPSNQVEMIKACGIVCGKDRVDTYDSIRGECKCLK